MVCLKLPPQLNMKLVELVKVWLLVTLDAVRLNVIWQVAMAWQLGFVYAIQSGLPIVLPRARGRYWFRSPQEGDSVLWDQVLDQPVHASINHVCGVCKCVCKVWVYVYGVCVCKVSVCLACTHVCWCEWVCVCECAYVCMSLCVFMCLYVFACMCQYLYAYLFICAVRWERFINFIKKSFCLHSSLWHTIFWLPNSTVMKASGVKVTIESIHTTLYQARCHRNQPEGWWYLL